MADARSSNGTPLFKNACLNCGSIRLSDRRRLGKPCPPCAAAMRVTHGLSAHPLYRLLKSMEARCRYPGASHYKYYGGRGIKVCDEWAKDPATFVAWALANGWTQGLEIDRLDTDGHYEPANCRFIAHVKNSQKRRNARMDETTATKARSLLACGKTVRDVARQLDVPYMVIWHISKGNTWRGSHDERRPDVRASL